MPVTEPSSTFVMDTGGANVKAGFSNSPVAKVIPNCITKAKSEKRRAFIGDQIDDCRDLSSLFYMLPFQKGYLVNWEHQKTVWDYVFSKNCFNVDTTAKSVVFTEPYFNFASIQDGLNEILFEEYRFKTVFRTTPADLACYKNRLENPKEPCCLVIDCGFSFTHVVPFVHGRRVNDAVRRIDVGGKLLTNHLKEIISYRQLHVLDETYVMNACREDCCYVSLDYDSDMRTAAKRSSTENSVARDYVLPDFTSLRRGHMKGRKESVGRPTAEGEQIIRMNNERFAVPELLFNPSDIGIEQAGIPETIVNVIGECPEQAQRWLYRNIVLVGGCTNIPNLRERVEREVRELAPDTFKVVVHQPPDPIGYAWQGGAAIAKDDCLKEISVSRADYLDRGHEACNNKFFL